MAARFVKKQREKPRALVTKTDGQTTGSVHVAKYEPIKIKLKQDTHQTKYDRIKGFLKC